LILLTDQDGLYDRDPRGDARARLIPVVGSEKVQVSTGRAGPRGTGGMGSKVSAARMAAAAGIPAVIANGFTPGTLQAILGGRGVGTLFLPRGTTLDKRRQWLAFASHPKGAIHVDEGAREALLRRSKSLLPSGVLSVSKSFEAGDVVSLVHDGAEFARGLANFGSRELELIKGLKTSLIEGALGRKAAGEVVHRDNMAPLEEP
ncbi:MAG: glutamate 5-kinase, partial [Elusimicrobiota bacterium]